MAQITLSISDQLASALKPFEDRMGEILELGIRRWNAADRGEFNGLTDILEKLAELPSPREVIDLRPSDELQARIDALLARNRSQGLDDQEELEWQRYEYLEHLVRLAKARAALLLRNAGDSHESDLRSE